MPKLAGRKTAPQRMHAGRRKEAAIDSSRTMTLIDSGPTAGIDGLIDITVAGGAAFLCDRAGLSSSVDSCSAGSGGSLTLIQSQPVPDGGSQEGIVAALPTGSTAGAIPADGRGPAVTPQEK